MSGAYHVLVTWIPAIHAGMTALGTCLRSGGPPGAGLFHKRRCQLGMSMRVVTWLANS